MTEEKEEAQKETGSYEEGFNNDREEVYSKIVRAGNRTYFFDVKATRKNDLYLTITESKKRFNKDGKFFFEKHKIFLYKEDFEKYTDGLTDAIEYVKANIKTEEFVRQPKEEKVKEQTTDEKTGTTDEFINVEFEDLGDK